MTTVSNNAYGDLGLGTAFELLAWQGIVAMDQLRAPAVDDPPVRDAPVARRTARTRTSWPAIARAVGERKPLKPIMREATATFLGLRDRDLPRRPLVGINGEIYLRANRFCNKDLVGLCEANGLEAEVSPHGEWFQYTGIRNVEDAWKNRELGRIVKGSLRKLALETYERPDRRLVRGQLSARPSRARRSCSGPRPATCPAGTAPRRCYPSGAARSSSRALISPA